MKIQGLSPTLKINIHPRIPLYYMNASDFEKCIIPSSAAPKRNGEGELPLCLWFCIVFCSGEKQRVTLNSLVSAGDSDKG